MGLDLGSGMGVCVFFIKIPHPPHIHVVSPGVTHTGFGAAVNASTRPQPASVKTSHSSKRNKLHGVGPASQCLSNPGLIESLLVVFKKFSL